MFYAYYLIHVEKNVRVKLEKKIILACNFGTLLFYTLMSSNTTLKCMFAQGRKDGWTNADHHQGRIQDLWLGGRE